MAELLIELSSEEIPARMQDGARAELARLVEKALAEAGVGGRASLTTYAGPRRLAVIARDLPERTEAVATEVKGPRTSAPPQALEGFLRKTGLTREELVEEDGIWFARTEAPGRPLAEVIAAAVPAIVRGFAWPKSMRWGEASIASTSLRWVRPLSGLIVLLDGAVVECGVDDIRAGRETPGHRFHAPGAVRIESAASYVAQLRAAHVLVDQDERRAIIREGAARAAAAAGLTLVEDEGLVAENAGLTEWPVPLLGRFDPAFLTVPQEVIQLTARVNQKYFICRDAAGALAPAFVLTANVAASDGGEAIIAGNGRVLAARLADARFFFERDVAVPLDAQNERLGRILFHERLGTLAERVERIAALARWLAAEGWVPGANPALAERAARLAKADLVSEMVGEFPEVQGVMGGYYAAAQGEDAAVAAAVRDHYRPLGAGDGVPDAPVTVAVALADKLDTLAAFFAIDERPTGSKDPFALRRAALGVLRLIVGNGLRLPLSALKAPLTAGRGEAWWPGLTAFLMDRLKVQQRDEGVRHDQLDAVMAGGEDDLVRLLARVRALGEFLATPAGADLLAAHRRASNLLRQASEGAGEGAGGDAVDPAAPSAPAEQALAAALAAAEPALDDALAGERYGAAMTALAALRTPIDAFFTDLMVNDPDPAVRAGRLALLARFVGGVDRVADLSRIEG